MTSEGDEPMPKVIDLIAARQHRDARRIDKTFGSICSVLRLPSERLKLLGHQDPLTFDTMRLQVMHRGKVVVEDQIVSAVRELYQEAYGVSPGVQDIQMAISRVARQQPFHPIRAYFERIEWDGVARLHQLPELFGAEDGALTRAILRNMMLSAIARVFSPGCQVDTIVILVGPQGYLKSTAFRTLAGDEFFSDSPVDIGQKDGAMVLQNAWIHELAELDSMLKTTDTTMRSFVTRRQDDFRPPYGRTVQWFPRQSIMVGTTNDERFLTDPAGNRRYWPVQVVRRIDVERIRELRDQLWAEAGTLTNQGVQWHLTPAEEAELKRRHAKHFDSDPWEDAIRAWLSKSGDPPTTIEVAHGALGLDHIIRLDWKDSRRIGRILTTLGYRRQAVWREGATLKAWVNRVKKGSGAPKLGSGVHDE